MNRTAPWWKHKPTPDDQRPNPEVAHVLSNQQEILEDSCSLQYWKDRVHESIYDNKMYETGGGYDEALEMLRRTGFTAAKLNVARSIVQTIVSKLGVKRPAIKANADDVDWSYKQLSRQLTKVVRGSTETLKVADEAPGVLKEACITGTGATYVGSDDGDVVIERIPREELFIDPREARYGKPRCLYRRRMIAREVLADRYSDFADEIEQAAPTKGWPDEQDLDFDQSTMIDVVEAWHLPSGKEAEDGRYALVIDGACLVYSRYDRKRFPIAFMHYDKPRKGFWSRGVIEDLADIQWKIDETVRDIQQSLYFGAQLRIWTRQGSTIPKSYLGRLARPAIMEHDGVKPIYDAPNPVSKDQVQFLEFLINKAYDLTGISQMSAQAKNPIGSGASAVALQEFYDIQSERYASLEKNVTAWWMDVSELILDTYAELSEEDEDYSVKWNDRTTVQQIKWSQLDLKRDQCRLVLEPSNFLPDTRAGKLEAIERLAKVGILVDSELSAVMAGYPDLERANRLRNAAYEVAEWIMEKLADEDTDLSELAPDAHLDLDLTKRMAQAEYNRARTEYAPEQVLERYRWFLTMITNMINATKQAEAPMPQQPGMPGMPAPPPAAPMPPEGAPAMPPMPGVPPGVLPQQ